jgi:hypothetical protein
MVQGKEVHLQSRGNYLFAAPSTNQISVHIPIDNIKSIFYLEMFVLALYIFVVSIWILVICHVI